ncbi:MAG: hypothetical protein M0Z27_10825 [Thermaerobacter sp.]|nr:hypothetical protein [Thermaerobacter sp.]
MDLTYGAVTIVAVALAWGGLRAMACRRWVRVHNERLRWPW